MRELKFRAWDIENKEMISEGNKGIDPTYLLHTKSYSPYSSDWEIMEWTGLKDKTGRDIYEGDIIKDRNSEAEWVRPVIWLASEARFGADDGGGDIWMISEDAEVIGNIYEHAHLLEGGV